MENKTVKIDTNKFIKEISERIKEIGAEALTFPTVHVKIPNSNLSNLGISLNRISENVYQITLSDNDNILIVEYFYWGLENAADAFLDRVKSTIENVKSCKKLEEFEFQA